MDIPGYKTIPYGEGYSLMIYQDDIITNNTYLNSQKVWGNPVYSSNEFVGADSSAIGNQNTAKIAIANMASDTAAKACLNLTTSAGYLLSDWYMASADELMAVYQAGYIGAGPYLIWTSTEKDRYTAYALDADSGDMLTQNKNGSYVSLPVRKVFSTESKKKAVEGSTMIPTKGLALHVDFSNRKSYSPNLMNYSVWTPGSGSISENASLFGVTQYDAIGWHGEDSRSLGADPFGMTSAVIWNSSTTDDVYGTVFEQSLSPGDGGWDSGHASIDSRKMYRFSVWVKKNLGAIFSGYTYLGHRPMDSAGTTWSAFKNNGSYTDGTNPYFHYTEETDPPSMGGSGEWTLYAGHVWPSDTAAGSIEPGSNISNPSLPENYAHPDSGVWTVEGKQGNLKYSSSTSEVNGSDWIWTPGTKTSRHRAYLYYGAETGLDPETMFIATTASFVYPRIDLVDGNEPSMKELISGVEPLRNLAGWGTAYAHHHTNWSPANGGCMLMQKDKFMGFKGTMSAPFDANAIAVWFYPSSTITDSSVGQALCGFRTLGGQDMQIYLGSVTGLATGEVITIAESNKRTVATGISISGSAWHCVAISWKNSSYEIYLDGTKLTASAGTGGHVSLQVATGYAEIGGRFFSGYPELSFDGKLSSVMAWDRSLSAAEISELWKTGSARLR